MVIINLITLTSVYLHCWYHKTIKILVNISDDWMRNSRCLVRILFKTRNADVHVAGMDFYQFNFFPSLYLHIAHFALQKFHVARTTWSVEKPLVTNFVNRTSVWSCGFFIRQLHMKPPDHCFRIQTSGILSSTMSWTRSHFCNSFIDRKQLITEINYRSESITAS